MELEIYNAFVKAGVPEADAKAAVESINREIDKRYALHATQLATRGDVEGVRRDVAQLKAEVKTDTAEMEARLLRTLADMQRWTIGSMFAAVGLFAAVTKIWH
ncbi:hypothetical protein NS331_21950 [Pseudacidovorax intermedius]|uniref:DUF1640 domain-containing protein n=2 Tax=Pseudacidovorax intermedius TaxID=433924 RepID=A0A147GMZ2_9BURK|nr:hypothetical protein NS331_21950 [Pseudacidovorax intermedius]